MGLKNMSLVTAATITVAGGSPLVFADDGQTIQNGVHLVVPADTDFQTRRQLTAKYRSPTLDSRSGTYGKDKKSISYAVPVVLATGQVVFNTIRIERELHPSTTIAAAAEMNKVGAQLLVDSDVDGFWSTGSMS